MRKRLAGISLIIAFAAAAVVILATPSSLTRQALAIPEATLGISPSELQQQIDIKSLPTQETADLI